MYIIFTCATRSLDTLISDFQQCNINKKEIIDMKIDHIVEMFKSLKNSAGQVSYIILYIVSIFNANSFHTINNVQNKSAPKDQMYNSFVGHACSLVESVLDEYIKNTIQSQVSNQDGLYMIFKLFKLVNIDSNSSNIKQLIEYIKQLEAYMKHIGPATKFTKENIKYKPLKQIYVEAENIYNTDKRKKDKLAIFLRDMLFMETLYYLATHILNNRDDILSHVGDVFNAMLNDIETGTNNEFITALDELVNFFIDQYNALIRKSNDTWLRKLQELVNQSGEIIIKSAKINELSTAKQDHKDLIIDIIKNICVILRNGSRFLANNIKKAETIKNLHAIMQPSKLMHDIISCRQDNINNNQKDLCKLEIPCNIQVSKFCAAQAIKRIIINTDKLYQAIQNILSQVDNVFDYIIFNKCINKYTDCNQIINKQANLISECILDGISDEEIKIVMSTDKEEPKWDELLDSDDIDKQLKSQIQKLITEENKWFAWFRIDKTDKIIKNEHLDKLMRIFRQYYNSNNNNSTKNLMLGVLKKTYQYQKDESHKKSLQKALENIKMINRIMKQKIDITIKEIENIIASTTCQANKNQITSIRNIMNTITNNTKKHLNINNYNNNMYYLNLIKQFVKNDLEFNAFVRLMNKQVDSYDNQKESLSITRCNQQNDINHDNLLYKKIFDTSIIDQIKKLEDSKQKKRIKAIDGGRQELLTKFTDQLYKSLNDLIIEDTINEIEANPVAKKLIKRNIDKKFNKLFKLFADYICDNFKLSEIYAAYYYLQSGNNDMFDNGKMHEMLTKITKLTSSDNQNYIILLQKELFNYIKDNSNDTEREMQLNWIRMSTTNANVSWDSCTEYIELGNTSYLPYLFSIYISKLYSTNILKYCEMVIENIENVNKSVNAVHGVSIIHSEQIFDTSFSILIEIVLCIVIVLYIYIIFLIITFNAQTETNTREKNLFNSFTSSKLF